MKVRARYKHWLPRWLDVTAITLYPFVLFDCTYEQAIESRVAHHEMVHVRQVRAAGWLAFYWKYLVDYARLRFSGKDHNAAYFEVPWEKAAYDEQASIELTPAELLELKE